MLAESSSLRTYSFVSAQSPVAENMGEQLQTLDVTDSAEDDDQLKRKTRHMYGRSNFCWRGTSVDCIDVQIHHNGGIKGWFDASSIAVRGPYEHTTDVIIRLDSEDGIVKIFVGDRVVRSCHTNPTIKVRDYYDVPTANLLLLVGERRQSDDETLGILTHVMQGVPREKIKPFERVTDREISKEDKAFILRIMKLDPRDRPTAKELLEDVWFKVDEELEWLSKKEVNGRQMRCRVNMCEALLILNLNKEHDIYCPCPRCERDGAIIAITLRSRHWPR